MGEINFMIMSSTLDIINRDLVGLPRGDSTLLRLVEFRPRSESFADVVLSCSISPNDPDNPNSWKHEQIVKWPPQQGFSQSEAGQNFNEIGGGVGYFHRFTVDFQLFYNEIGASRDRAIESAWIILARIQSAIVKDRSVYPKIGVDDFGRKLVRWDKAVTGLEVLPKGSSEEVFIQAKMWLQFEAYHE